MLALLKKNLVIIGIIAVAIGVLYYFYSSNDSGALLTSSEQEEGPVSQEILATLNNLRTIELDDSIFQDPLFLSLSDFGVTIPPVPAGRRNPFAPVGAGNAPTTQATSTAPASAN